MTAPRTDSHRRAGVNGGSKISAAFKGRGLEGAELDRQIQAQLHRGTMRLMGSIASAVVTTKFNQSGILAPRQP
jgi:hypothetical protein